MQFLLFLIFVLVQQPCFLIKNYTSTYIHLNMSWQHVQHIATLHKSSVLDSQVILYQSLAVL